MSKKLLAAAIITAVSLSTVPAFAGPIISGDANIEYNDQKNNDSDVTNRIRLVIDNPLGDDFYVRGRAVLNNSISHDPSSNQANNSVEIEQAFIGGRVGSFDIKAGRQPLWLGKGALADVNGINGLQAATNINNVYLNSFYGKDDQNHVTAADIATTYGAVNMGATYLREADHAKFFAVNADTAIRKNTVLNMEYVKNTETKGDGFIAEVKVGNAVKPGDLDYAVAYRNIDAGAVSSYSNSDDSYNDSEGLRLKANYKLTDSMTLTAYQDFVDSQNGINKNKTNVEVSVKF